MKRLKLTAILLACGLSLGVMGCTTAETKPKQEETQQQEKSAEELAELAKKEEEAKKKAAEEEAMKNKKEGEAAPMVEAPAAKEEAATIAQLETIYFDFDKSDVREDSKAALAKNYEWIKGNPNVKVQLEGHADERGTNEYNLALGERRAKAILNYLIALGANPEQFTTISYGEERPAAAGHEEDSWGKNRRVEFTRM